MPKCSFCGEAEKKQSPLCLTCGALRYPVEKNGSNKIINRQKKLKYSASVAAAIFTPGSLVVLALLGANRINTKIKNRKTK